MRTDAQWEKMDATSIVLDFLTGVNLDMWRKNMPVTGCYEVDVPKLRESIAGYVLRGSQYPIFEPKNDNEVCGKMTYWLAKRMLDSVDWEKVLTIWYTAVEPAKDEIVEDTWTYYYDNDGGGPPGIRVAVHTPEWIGKPCGDCCFATEHFRRPEWVTRG